MHKYHKIVFIAFFNVLRLITVLGAKSSKKLISPRVLWTSITNCVLCWFDRFTACYNCMRKNVTSLISPWVHWTSITNRVFSLLHRSRAFYHYIKKNVTKLISTRILWTSITNRVLSRFDRFMSYLNCIKKNYNKTDIFVSSVYKYHRSCS